jgi:hypothetical protein
MPPPPTTTLTEGSSVSPICTVFPNITSASRSSTTTSSNTAIWRTAPPFEKHYELCKELHYTTTIPSHSSVPEKVRHLHTYALHQTLPDAPRIPLSSQIIPYCLSDLDTPSLNTLGEKLWWVGPTPELKSLSEQMTLERNICITEDPNMHCIWTENTSFLKPIPAYLCSFAFWEYLLDPLNDGGDEEERERLRATALGFLRTYARLVQRRSDFNIAVRNDLVPAKVEFEEFIRFISSFDNIPDSQISIRWRFGELILDALNFHSLIHLRKYHLNRYESRYGPYFQRFFPVVLFMFALFSVALSAMQVILGAHQLKEESQDKGLRRTTGIFIWFGTEAIAWSVAFGAVFVIWWVCISGGEAWKRRKVQRRMKRKLKEDGEAMP